MISIQKLQLSKHITDDKKRIDFLNDIKGDYIINSLDFSVIINYDFNDGNNYTFQNCILDNLKLAFQNESIVFDSCLFKGEISINNIGVGLDDLIVLANITITSLTIKSPFIELYETRGNKLVAEADSYSMDNSEISDCHITYNSSCDIISSTINRLVLVNNPIDPDDFNSEDLLTITDSNINDHKIDNLVEDRSNPTTNKQF